VRGRENREGAKCANISPSKAQGDNRMPYYLIELNFGEQLELTPEGAAAINLINDEESVRWLI
jgi:hypothetical protein